MTDLDIQQIQPKPPVPKPEWEWKLNGQDVYIGDSLMLYGEHDGVTSSSVHQVIALGEGGTFQLNPSPKFFDALNFGRDHQYTVDELRKFQAKLIEPLTARGYSGMSMARKLNDALQYALADALAKSTGVVDRILQEEREYQAIAALQRHHDFFLSESETMRREIQRVRDSKSNSLALPDWPASKFADFAKFGIFLCRLTVATERFDSRDTPSLCLVKPVTHTIDSFWLPGDKQPRKLERVGVKPVSAKGFMVAVLNGKGSVDSYQLWNNTLTGQLRSPHVFSSGEICTGDYAPRKNSVTPADINREFEVILGLLNSINPDSLANTSSFEEGFEAVYDAVQEAYDEEHGDRDDDDGERDEDGNFIEE